MKKHKKLYAVITLLIIVVLIFVVNNIKICSVNSHEADYVFDLFQNEYNSENVDICILDYDYVTGASWRVEKSTNKDIENEYMCVLMQFVTQDY